MGFYQSGRGETMRGGYQTIFRLPSHGYLKESLGAIGTTYFIRIYKQYGLSGTATGDQAGI